MAEAVAAAAATEATALAATVDGNTAMATAAVCWSATAAVVLVMWYC